MYFRVILQHFMYLEWQIISAEIPLFFPNIVQGHQVILKLFYTYNEQAEKQPNYTYAITLCILISPHFCLFFIVYDVSFTLIKKQM